MQRTTLLHPAPRAQTVRWRKLHVARAGCLTAIEQTSFYHAQKLQEKARMVLERWSQFSLPTIADERPFEGAIVLTRDCDKHAQKAGVVTWCGGHMFARTRMQRRSHSQDLRWR
mmetsp:Transcript_20563/g.53135  ORF Transcript_20563/g.53135 Transcript_20563/m.53135 type:complete len:114 (+) Transcript_20563:656-997(+)